MATMMQSIGMQQHRHPASGGTPLQHGAGAGAGARRGQQQAGGFDPADTFICSLHNKPRGSTNVEETYAGSRQWRCKPGAECKMPDQSHQVKTENTGPTPPGNVTCVMHGKQRGPNNVEPSFPGATTWKCKAGSECKASAQQKPMDTNAPPGPVACHLHNKQRGPNNVEETYHGSRVYRCRPGSECKLPANPESVPKQHEEQTCSIHGKERGPNNVMQVPGTNQWQCKPGCECKMPSAELSEHTPIHPSEPALCWAHTKKRSPNQLHQVNTPFGAQWECLPQYKCKGTAGAPAPTAMTTQQLAASTAGFPIPAVPVAGIPDMGAGYSLHHQLMHMPMNASMMHLQQLQQH